MSLKQLTDEALALPISERVSLAQTLWESIHDGLPETSEEEAIREALIRDEELSSGKVEGVSHEEVMRNARRALGCE